MQTTFSPFSIANVRQFIIFRIYFNSRFYYPVFTILFLDFGLTLTQFALLNVVWAATIVLLEVPSGALADTIGRKNLIVFASVLMVLELAIICFVPLGNTHLIFAAFLLNRILSGIAEAAASGADEALAYDSLAREGDKEEWGSVLERLMRWQSVGFTIAMTLGAVMYDAGLLNQMAKWLGLSMNISQETTMRFPLYATLILSFFALRAALCMEEPKRAEHPTSPDRKTVSQAIALTMQTGVWLLRSPVPLAIILFGMLFDHSIRLILTLTSQYYRVISYPEAVFGIIGSGMALLGIVVPRGALWLAENRTRTYNVLLLGSVAFAGFWSLSLALPYTGIIPMILLMCVFHAALFFVSHYLNAEIADTQRATVLSFRGLSNNLAYGGIGILYSVLLALLREHTGIVPDVETTVFIHSLSALPWYFIALFVICWTYCAWRLTADKTKKQKRQE